MPTTRDKLIADWKGRLAAAEAMDFTSPSRPAWLARLQIRLYRFLLAIYGDADWTTSPPPVYAQRSVETDSDSDSAIFDSPVARSQDGKPVKTPGKIQAVLKTVANAQDHALPPGPLVAGVSADCVVIAASQSSNIHPGRLVRLFERAGIACQARACGQDVVVEVAARNLSDALLVIELNRECLRMKRRQPQLFDRRFKAPGGWLALCILLLVPQLSFLVIAALSFAPGIRSQNEQFVFEQYVLPVWGAAAIAAFICFLPMCATILLHGWRARRDAEQAIPPGREPS